MIITETKRSLLANHQRTLLYVDVLYVILLPFQKFDHKRLEFTDDH